MLAFAKRMLSGLLSLTVMSVLIYFFLFHCHFTFCLLFNCNGYNLLRRYLYTNITNFCCICEGLVVDIQFTPLRSCWLYPPWLEGQI